jgi:hypothetical protein
MGNRKSVIVFSIIAEICLLWVLVRLLREIMPEEFKLVHLVSRGFLLILIVIIIISILHIILVKL